MIINVVNGKVYIAVSKFFMWNVIIKRDIHSMVIFHLVPISLSVGEYACELPYNINKHIVDVGVIASKIGE